MGILEEDALRDGRTREENEGMSLLQGWNLTVGTKRQKTPEERYRMMGKAPMEKETPAITTPNGRERNCYCYRNTVRNSRLYGVKTCKP